MRSVSPAFSIHPCLRCCHYLLLHCTIKYYICTALIEYIYTYNLSYNAQVTSKLNRVNSTSVLSTYVVPKKIMGSGASSGTSSNQQQHQIHFAGVMTRSTPFASGAFVARGGQRSQRSQQSQQSRQSERSNRSHRSKDSEASRLVTTQASSSTRQCSNMKSMESTVTPRSPMGSLGLERKKSVTFGAHEVLSLDKDSGRKEVQSYQIDGKESNDLGDPKGPWSWFGGTYMLYVQCRIPIWCHGPWVSHLAKMHISG